MKDTSETFHDRLAELYLHSLEDESEPPGTTFLPRSVQIVLTYCFH